MRTSLSIRQRILGGTLFATIIITAIIGIALAAYLTHTTNQNQLVVRSQVWNSALPVAEAGLEEAFTHCYWNFPTNMATEGWDRVNNDYAKRNLVGDGGLGGPGRRLGTLKANGYFEVSITSNTPMSFTVTSAGYFPMPGSDTHVKRTIKVSATNLPVFVGPMVLKDKVDMNGNNVVTDSYDSTDVSKSTLGKYDPAKAGDNGDIACLSGLKNAFGVGNANIWGRVFTGPSGTVEVGPGGAVGSVAWQQGGNSGVEPGWWQKDLNYSMPDVEAPFASAAPPGSGAVGTNNYSFIMGSGNYMLNKLDADTLITGNAVLYVTGDIKFSTDEKLVIAPGASLKIYCGASGAIFGIVDNQNVNPATFMYLGLPSNKTIDFQGQAGLTCTVYAPSAALTFNGHSTIYGSIVASGAKLNGNAAIHYDESLRKILPRRGFIILSWNEWNEN
jgi:hypothetical protein